MEAAKKSRRASRSSDTGGSARNRWTFLVYLCGDNSLDDEIYRDFAELCHAGSQRDVRVFVQIDRRSGASRHALPLHPTTPDQLQSDASLDHPRVNTGDPAEAEEFFRWALSSAPPGRVAVIFGGLGLKPEYVRQRARGADEKEKKRQELKQLFSLCHDETDRDGLNIQELCHVMRTVHDTLGRPADVLGLDVCGAAFVEIAYELEDLADVFVAVQGSMPDGGWPYEKIVKGWQQKIAGGTAGAHDLARLIVQETAETYAGQKLQLVAVNLKALNETARVLDTLAMALLQNLGVWHVLDAVRKAVRKETARIKRAGGDGVGEWLPAVDMISLLQGIRDSLTNSAPKVPEEFDQQRRVKELGGLTEKALEAIASETASGPPLLLAAAPVGCRGLSIFLPQPTESLEKESADFSDSNYFELNFSRSVHWAALVGTFRLIVEKPHVLWRLISAVLADARGASRDALLRNLVSRDSVVEGLKPQFQALSADAALSLSLEPKGEAPTTGATGKGRIYRLRLESTVKSAVVVEQDSPVYQATIDAALTGLEVLLNSGDSDCDAAHELEAFGRTLGEDLIQDLTDRLAQERADAGGDAVTAPHLRLQIPRDLMPYPWELMHDGQGMLCERYALGRQVFMEGRLARRVARRKPGPVRVLVIGDPQFTPEGLKNYEENYGGRPGQLAGAALEAGLVADEFERLNAVLGGLPELKVVRCIGQTLTSLQFRDRLREGAFDIIHYAGHGIFDRADPEGSAWLLSDGPLHAREIRNTLARLSVQPWLVFANACETGMDAGTSKNAYQGDVFGLATAFINQGVAAYIAPLWPVDDHVAEELAMDFYDALLRERTSVGEALRIARVRAWERMLPFGSKPGNGDREVSQTSQLPPRVALSWASMVLYGDPTPRLLESLWSPHAAKQSEPDSPPPVTPTPVPSRRGAEKGRRLTQAPGGAARALVTGPGMEEVSRGSLRSRAETRGPDFAGVRLVEQGGIRFYELVDPSTHLATRLPGSPIGALHQQESVRGQLNVARGWLDLPRIVGEWVVGKFTGDDRTLLLRLAEQYDKDTVATEGILLVAPSGRLEPLDSWTWLDDPLKPGQSDRALLIIPGTFSKTASPVTGLGEDFLNEMRKRYRAVIGFDHWTLSRTPEDNARLLWERLSPRLHAGNKIDVITHSRGGLIARALIQLVPGGARAVRRVVFVGTPNAGTNLANPKNWGRAADVLVNLLHVDSTGMFGKMSGFLVQLLARGVLGTIPGLQAQNPSAAGAEDFLGRVRKWGPLPAGISYSAVAANYEPAPNDSNLMGLLSKAGDTTIDGLYPGPNDLVVDTAHVWSADSSTAKFGTLDAIIPAERVLLFNPDAQVLGPNKVRLEKLTGVHHTNLFEVKQTREFLLAQLG